MSDIIYPPVPMESADLAIVFAQTNPGTKVHLDLPYNFNNKQGNPKLGWGFRVMYDETVSTFYLKWDLHEHDTCCIAFHADDNNLWIGWTNNKTIIGPPRDPETWKNLLKTALQEKVLSEFSMAAGNYKYFRDIWPEAMRDPEFKKKLYQSLQSWLDALSVRLEKLEAHLEKLEKEGTQT